MCVCADWGSNFHALNHFQPRYSVPTPIPFQFGKDNAAITQIIAGIGFLFRRSANEILTVRNEFAITACWFTVQDSAIPTSFTFQSTIQWIDRSQNNSFGCQISACFQYLLLKYSPFADEQFIQSKGNCRTRFLLGAITILVAFGAEGNHGAARLTKWDAINACYWM